jgi:hypothetical protein
VHCYTTPHCCTPAVAVAVAVAIGALAAHTVSCSSYHSSCHSCSSALQAPSQTHHFRTVPQQCALQQFGTFKSTLKRRFTGTFFLEEYSVLILFIPLLNLLEVGSHSRSCLQRAGRSRLRTAQRLTKCDSPWTVDHKIHVQ